MRKSTEVVELKIGDTIEIGDLIVENRIGQDMRYTVYKINKKMVAAYSEFMSTRKFPIVYSENYKGHLCKSVAKVYRYKKD